MRKVAEECRCWVGRRWKGCKVGGGWGCDRWAGAAVAAWPTLRGKGHCLGSTFRSITEAGVEFASQYRVDTSRTTLREFQNLSGRPIVGSLVWMAMKAGMLKLSSQVLDGPKPFQTNEATLDSVLEPVRGRLLALSEQAMQLGFHSHSCSVSNSAGVVAHGGSLRMLHESGQFFLQIIASCSGEVMNGYESIVSATTNPVAVFSSTNGPPHYNSPPGVTVKRHVGASLGELVDAHRAMVADLAELVPLQTYDEVGRVLDHLSFLFFSDKVARGIFVPVA